VFGQVGAGDTAWRSTPARAQGLPPVARLEVGPEHVCALDQEGALWCWGSDREGQLGTKAPETCRSDLIEDQGRKVPCATRPLRVPPPSGR
jgi:alpha-tubulin suppressor-like RCC1 family protein